MLLRFEIWGARLKYKWIFRNWAASDGEKFEEHGGRYGDWETKNIVENAVCAKATCTQTSNMTRIRCKFKGEKPEVPNTAEKLLPNRVKQMTTKSLEFIYLENGSFWSRRMYTAIATKTAPSRGTAPRNMRENEGGPHARVKCCPC